MEEYAPRTADDGGSLFVRAWQVPARQSAVVFILESRVSLIFIRPRNPTNPNGRVAHGSSRAVAVQSRVKVVSST